MKPLLLFHNKLADSQSLLEGRLLLLDAETGTTKNIYKATSGCPGWQEYQNISSIGKGPIPPQNEVNIPHYTVATTPIYMPQVRGVEGNFYKINPHLVQISGKERGDFGIHFDANYPGSAGCLVLTSNQGWSGFQADMKNLATDEITSVPLVISYIR